MKDVGDETDHEIFHAMVKIKTKEAGWLAGWLEVRMKHMLSFDECEAIPPAHSTNVHVDLFVLHVGALRL